MRTIRKLAETELMDYVHISANAYPGIKVVTGEQKQRMRDRLATIQESPGAHLYGLWADGELLGGMRWHDFQMQLRSTPTLVGGLGGVAVALTHKKEKVARDMVQHFLQHYREKDACLAALYPFRPDFYRRMGFGYGSKMNQYRIRPSSLPRGASKANISLLNAGDKAALAICYHRLMAQTNGLFAKESLALDEMFRTPALQIVGYKQGSEIEGYLSFTFKPRNEDNFLQHDLIIREFVYLHREALSQLLAFLHAQDDQVGRILFQTQDDSFHFLLNDPRDGAANLIPLLWHETNVQGVGIMYRVIDVRRLFAVLAEHQFGVTSGRLRLVLTDTFLPDNAGTYGLLVEDGRIRLVEPDEGDVALYLDVADFSSLMVGAVGLRQLYNHNLAEISDPAYLDTLHRLFWSEQRPLCMTSF